MYQALTYEQSCTAFAILLFLSVLQVNSWIVLVILAVHRFPVTNLGLLCIYVVTTIYVDLLESRIFGDLL